MSPKQTLSRPIEQPRLIIISAPSGAGKTTLCDRVVRDFSNTRLSVSTTTRPRRPNEVHGIHYWFVSTDEFRQRISTGDFAEWAMVHGHHYGTLKSTISENIRQGYHTVFDIDVQGALNLRHQYPTQSLLIFIRPPSMQELEKRLRKRQSDSDQSIEKRLQHAHTELSRSSEFDYQIINEDLEAAYAELKEVVKNQCQ